MAGNLSDIELQKIFKLVLLLTIFFTSPTTMKKLLEDFVIVWERMSEAINIFFSTGRKPSRPKIGGIEEVVDDFVRFGYVPRGQDETKISITEKGKKIAADSLHMLIDICICL